MDFILWPSWTQGWSVRPATCDSPEDIRWRGWGPEILISFLFLKFSCSFSGTCSDVGFSHVGSIVQGKQKFEVITLQFPLCPSSNTFDNRVLQPSCNQTSITADALHSSLQQSAHGCHTMPIDEESPIWGLQLSIRTTARMMPGQNVWRPWHGAWTVFAPWCMWCISILFCLSLSHPHGMKQSFATWLMTVVFSIFRFERCWRIPRSRSLGSGVQRILLPSTGSPSWK